MGLKSHQKMSTMKLIFFLICLLPKMTLTITIPDASTTTSTTESPSSTTSQKTEVNTTFSVSTSSSDSKSSSADDLDKDESKNPQKLEILKQIRKINADGSYTIGYEAEDGTFKIESRDVLGNVKGTYGYIDENGEIKRVSYTANNATGVKTITEDTETEGTVQLPKYNSSSDNKTVSTTRRPSLSTTKSSNVQSIPRRRYHFERIHGPNKVGQEVNSLNAEPTTTVVYATSISSTAKPVLLVRPTQVPYGVRQTGGEQIIRPEKLEAAKKTKKEEKEENKSRNHLRRQLSSENTENFETQQQIIYGQSAGDDNTHIYGGGPASVSVRPLYSPTATPRVPVQVLAARQRAAQLVGKSPSTTTERVYVKSPKRIEQSTEQQTAGPVVQIPPGRDLNEVAEDERRQFRERPGYRPRDYVRYVPTTGLPSDQRIGYRNAVGVPAIPLQNYRQEEQQQFLRETTRVPIRRPQGDGYAEGQGQNPEYREQGGRAAAAGGYPGDYQQYPPYPFAGPYRGQGGSPFDYPDRPLTTRDFERLLQLLIYRHTELQRYGGGARGGLGGYGNPYYPSASPYPPSAPYYGYQIPRPPYYNPLYDPRGYENPSYSPSTPARQYPPPQAPQTSSEGPTENEQNLNQINQYYDSQRTVPRRREFLPPPPSRQYSQQSTQVPYNEADYATNSNQLGPGPAPNLPDYLPPHVREDLLYRMFMLAIRTDNAYADRGQQPQASEGNVAQATNIEPTTIAPVTSRKPVRSVQILGEEEP